MRVYTFDKWSAPLGDGAGYLLQHIPAQGEQIFIRSELYYVTNRCFMINANNEHEVFLTLWSQKDFDEQEKA